MTQANTMKPDTDTPERTGIVLLIHGNLPECDH